MAVTETNITKYSIMSDRREIPGVVNKIIDYLRKTTPIGECECLFDIKVVLSELISNAVIHGNEEDLSKPVDINISFDGKKLDILIVDRGVAFTPDKNREEVLMCESSRGISICQILCGKLIYKFIDGLGNSARAVFILK